MSLIYFKTIQSYRYLKVANKYIVELQNLHVNEKLQLGADCRVDKKHVL